MRHLHLQVASIGTASVPTSPQLGRVWRRGRRAVHVECCRVARGETWPLLVLSQHYTAVCWKLSEWFICCWFCCPYALGSKVKCQQAVTARAVDSGGCELLHLAVACLTLVSQYRAVTAEKAVRSCVVSAWIRCLWLHPGSQQDKEVCRDPASNKIRDAQCGARASTGLATLSPAMEAAAQCFPGCKSECSWFCGFCLLPLVLERNKGLI